MDVTSDKYSKGCKQHWGGWEAGEVTGDLGKGDTRSLTLVRKVHIIQEKFSVGEVYLLQIPEGTKGINNSFVFFVVVRSLAPLPTEV